VGSERASGRPKRITIALANGLRPSGIRESPNGGFLPHQRAIRANVLFVDLHAPQAVNLLHFVEQIFLNRARPLMQRMSCGIDRTFGEAVSRSHPVTGVHPKVLAGGDLVGRSKPLCGKAFQSGGERAGYPVDRLGGPDIHRSKPPNRRS